jgi:hypothetical protein
VAPKAPHAVVPGAEALPEGTALAAGAGGTKGARKGLLARLFGRR